jgi:sporulation protein YlmC with PRC-barrel domain
MTFKFLYLGAMLLSVGTVPVAHATDPISDHERVTQQIGTEVGVPEPGSVSDQETTKKQRNPSKDQATDQNAQITLGGAKYFVSGKITQIQGDHYFVRDEESGDEVRLLVNYDTNLTCSVAEASTGGNSTSQVVAADRLSAKQQAPEASDRQHEQGQKTNETAMGSGFRIGTCSFKPGGRIKAEVDDMGRVTSLRSMPMTGSAEPQTARSVGEGAGTGELAIPGKQEKPGQLDMTGRHGYPPKQYALLPVPLGKFMPADQHALLNRSVSTPDGKILGSLETLIMDSETGQIEYAVVLVNDTNRMEVAPWARFKVRRDGDDMKLVLNTNQFQLSPGITGADMADRSPDLEKLVKDMENTRAPADLRDEDSGTTKSVSRHRPSPDLCAGKDCRVIRGRIMKLEDMSFMVKDTSGKEVHMVVDRKTQKGQVGGGRSDEFTVGDTIEAYITSTGHAESISLLRPTSGRPDEPEA